MSPACGQFRRYRRLRPGKEVLRLGLVGRPAWELGRQQVHTEPQAREEEEEPPSTLLENVPSLQP